MIKQLLEKLKMKGALAILQDLKKIKNNEHLLISLLQAELIYKENRSSKRRLSIAKFPVEKEWSDIDKSLNPNIDFISLESIDKNQIANEKRNICLIGHQGTGKTHSLIALGRKLCRQSLDVKFYTACSSSR